MESVTCFVFPSFAETLQFFVCSGAKRISVSFPAPVFTVSGKSVISSSADGSSAQISHGAPAAHFTFVSFNPSQYYVFDGSWLIFMLFCSSMCLAPLSNAALHLEADQIVHLHRVLQRQFF